MRVPFKCESKNLIHVVIFSGCREEYIGQTQAMLKERLNTYRQHIQQPELQQIEGHIRASGGGDFKLCRFLQFRKTAKS